MVVLCGNREGDAPHGVFYDLYGSSSTLLSIRGRTEKICSFSAWRFSACAAVDDVRDIGEIELLDRVLQQVEIATHLDRGIQGLRPRKKGPCHELILEFVANRKRKAHAVYRWTIAAGDNAGRHRRR